MNFNPRIVRPSDRADAQPDEVRFEGPPPRARPSDRLEPWHASGEARDELARAARARGVAVEIAAIVVVERSLLDEEFGRRGLASLVPELDAAARAAKIQAALSEPQRAYLHALCSHRMANASAAMPALVALPMRLTERVAATTLDGHLRCELLDSALTWERAAVTRGQTMTEWAGFAALDVLSSRR